MSKPQNGHYHCLECNTLFAAEIVSVRDQRCPVCGNPPTGKILAGTEQDRMAASVVRGGSPQPPVQPKLSGISSDTKDIIEATEEAQMGDKKGRVKRKKRKEKKSSKITAFIIVWLVIMASTVTLVHYFGNDDESDASHDIAIDNENDQQAQQRAWKEKQIINAAIPSCEEAITNFLDVTSAAAKAQYVYRGKNISLPMAKYYRINPSFTTMRGPAKIVQAQLLDYEGEQVIGTICQHSSGKKFEAIFVKEGNEWTIDWPALVRYNPLSWSLFPAGRNGDIGVFRLYMRVRETNEDLERKDMSVVFYKPDLYIENDDSRLASPSVRVPIDSVAGKRIQEMLGSDEDPRKDEYGFVLDDLDPPGYHRVRVRLKLDKTSGGPANIELLDIIANHWYGIDQVQTNPDLSIKD